MSIYDKIIANDVIIISLPYKLKDIKLAITQFIAEFISNNFNDGSLLSSFDIVLNFLNPNEQDIQSIMLNSNPDPENKKSDHTFNVKKCNEMIETNPILVINQKNADYITIPRNVDVFDPRHRTLEAVTDFTKYNESVICVMMEL